MLVSWAELVYLVKSFHRVKCLFRWRTLSITLETSLVTRPFFLLLLRGRWLADEEIVHDLLLVLLKVVLHPGLRSLLWSTLSFLHHQAVVLEQLPLGIPSPIRLHSFQTGRLRVDRLQRLLEVQLWLLLLVEQVRQVLIGVVGRSLSTTQVHRRFHLVTHDDWPAQWWTLEALDTDCRSIVGISWA